MDTQLDLVNFETSEDTKNASKYLSIDSASASWFLFNFSRTKEIETSAVKTFKSVLPDGSIQSVKIEVQSDYKKKGEDKKAGLPGALAQDVLFSLIDLYIRKVSNDEPQLEGSDFTSIGDSALTNKISNSRTKTPGSLFFTNTEVCKNIGLNIYNNRISDSIHHLNQTRIKISVSVFKNGKNNVIQHSTQYINTVSIGKRINGGVEEFSKQSVTFDPLILDNVLKGMVGQIDRDKFTQLSSGLQRRVYSLIASKKIKGFGQKIVITEEELRSITNAKDTNFARFANRTFKPLIDEGIINKFSFMKVNGIKCIVVDLSDRENALICQDATFEIYNYFKDLQRLSKYERSLKTIISDPSFNLDADIILDLIKKFKLDGETDIYKKGAETRVYSLAIMTLDKIIYSHIQGLSKPKNYFKYLSTMLDPNHENKLEIIPGYKPFDVRLDHFDEKEIAKNDLIQKEKNEEFVNQKSKEEIEFLKETVTTSQRKRILDFGKKYLPKNKMLSEDMLFNISAGIVFGHIIDNAMPANDIKSAVDEILRINYV